jgi:hypothetical protein
VFRDPQINTYVREVVGIVRFYPEQLGFVETFRTPEVGSPVHVEVRLGGLILGFADIEAARMADPEDGPVQVVAEHPVLQAPQDEGT